MKILSVEGNTQKLDGGAMFGNCPKAVWQKWTSPDESNRITLACRALLERIVAEDGWAFFTHDPEIAAARIARGADGRFATSETRRAFA